MSDEFVERVRVVCLALPEAYQEPAWIGTRWRVRGHTFAHVLPIEDGRPPVYARAVGTDGPVVVLTFSASLSELDALASTDRGYFRAHFGRDVGGLILGDDVDWDEVAELLTESYRMHAPRKLVDRLDPRPGPRPPS
ncbi:MmcQ/YjbR family DNA-binding protein [Pseudonocardia acaciae]|uniref:MmcQ/YjbR family DNA-binding protein n=1 Tax=Pseudonocardia acaciae TaxID=551276 RepID=UPI00048FAD8B|nr:MmcQ/YjbR family DNA-binding protein [Pseudonocardia acaciae]